MSNPDSLPKVLIIIPAYNEETSIATTLTELQSLIKEMPNVQICVINDGSTDQTAQTVKQFPVMSINLPYNLGIGAAVQTGYKYAYLHGYDIAVQFDADGQHDGQDLGNLLRPILTDEADMVLGSRFLEKTQYKGSLSRRLGILFFANLLSLLTRMKVTDPTSGYRAINKKVLKLWATSYPKDYPGVEVIVYLHKKKLRFKEIRVDMKPRMGGKSSITPSRSVYYMLKVTLSVLMRKFTKDN